MSTRFLDCDGHPIMGQQPVKSARRSKRRGSFPGVVIREYHYRPPPRGNTDWRDVAMAAVEYIFAPALTSPSRTGRRAISKCSGGPQQSSPLAWRIAA